MTIKEFEDKKRQQAIEDEPLKQVIRKYVGPKYEELLDFVVNFDRNKLRRYFKYETNYNRGLQTFR